MALPVDAGVGVVEIYPVATAVPVVKCVDYNPSGKSATTKLGPWIGDPTVVNIAGAMEESCKLTFDAVDGGDPGQAALVTATKTNLHSRLVFTATNGWKFDYASPSYTGYDVKAKAGGGQQFTIDLSGVCTVTHSP